MSSEAGLSLYFKTNKIRFRNSLIDAIGKPEYIHLFIDSNDKFLYVQSCEKDKDAFKVYFQRDESDAVFYIRAKPLLQYLSRLVGAKPSVSLRYSGIALDDGTFMIALDEYKEIVKEDVK